MNISFKQFVQKLDEVMMDVDLDDPQTAVQQVKNAVRQGEVKTARQQASAVVDKPDQQDVQDPLDRQIEAAKQRLLMLQQRKARQKQQQKAGI